MDMASCLFGYRVIYVYLPLENESSGNLVASDCRYLGLMSCMVHLLMKSSMPARTPEFNVQLPGRAKIGKLAPHTRLYVGPAESRLKLLIATVTFTSTSRLM